MNDALCERAAALLPRGLKTSTYGAGLIHAGKSGPGFDVIEPDFTFEF